MLLDIKNVNKCYGSTQALSAVNLEIDKGEIVGFFGPNGAGKTTLLRALLGLANVSGEMRVAGLDPKREPTRLMNEISFIADTAILPRWMKVNDCLAYVEKTHPKFDRAVAQTYLDKTNIKPNSKISQLSKGMVTQLHLAIVMSIDSSLLVLDEPTLGLDIVYRKNFYRDLLDNYFDNEKTILITTHQIEEIEDLVTRVVFINEGRIILNAAIDSIANTFHEVLVTRGKEQEAEARNPLHHASGLEGNIYWFAHQDNEALEPLGKIKTPKLADLFVAHVMHAKANTGDKQ